MDILDKQTYDLDGYKLCVIRTDKFKHISISIKFVNKLRKEEITKRTLLSSMFLTGTKQLPSLKAIGQYSDDLYGLNASMGTNSHGLINVLTVKTKCIDESFLPYKEDLLTKQVKLMDSFINDLNIKNNLFDQTVFERKKQDLKNRLKASKDDKLMYSVDQLFSNMGEGGVLSIPPNGYLDEIDDITNEELVNYYHKCLEQDEKYVFIVGNVDDKVVDIFKNNLKLKKANEHFLPEYIFESTKKEVKEVIETQDITQAKLNIGYQLGINVNSKEHHAFRVANELLGNSSQSKLFKIVREKNSLCYYITSSYNSIAGIMAIFAGIETNNYEKTHNLINEQIEKMKQGDFSEEDIALAKKTIISQYRKSFDNVNSIVNTAFTEVLMGYDSKYFPDKINAVSKEEIINASKLIKEDTIFCLKGSK